MSDAGRPAAPLPARLVVGLLTIAVTLGLLEAGVRLVFPQDLDYFNHAKLRRASSRPGWGWELVPGARSASYIGVPVAVNALGLRDAELSVPKPPGTVRIVAVGDSVTFGYGVRLEETFVEVLEQRLNAPTAGARYEVVNAGIEATDLGYYYNFLRTAAPRLEPDLVLVNLALNDIAVYEAGRAGPRKWRPAEAAGQGPSLVRRLNGALLLNSQAYLLSYRSLKSVLYRTGVLDINRVHDYDYLPLEPPSERQEQAWTTTLALLERLVRLTREHGWPVALVVFPMEVQLDEARLELYRREFGTRLGPEALTGEPQRRLRAFAGRHDVPIVDLLPVFRAGGDGLYLRNRAITYDPVHPSPRGHRLAGEAIHEALRAAAARRADWRAALDARPPAAGGTVAGTAAPTRGIR